MPKAHIHQQIPLHVWRSLPRGRRMSSSTPGPATVLVTYLLLLAGYLLLLAGQRC